METMERLSFMEPAVETETRAAPATAPQPGDTFKAGNKTGTFLAPLKGGASCHARGINNKGQVVGASDTGSGPGHACLWQPGELVPMDLGTLEGDESSIASAINNKGQVVGMSQDAKVRQRPFLWEDGEMKPMVVPEGEFGMAFGINNRGQVAGTYFFPGGGWCAGVWHRGKVKKLGVLPGDNVSFALGINNRGQVVGMSQASSGDQHPFLWYRGTMINLGTLGGFKRGIATGINNHGQVAGWDNIPDEWPFLWEMCSMTKLGMRGIKRAYAYDINARGQIVGIAKVSTGKWHAILWRPKKPDPVDLGLPGLSSGTRAINNRGHIVGSMGNLAVLWK